MKKVIVILIVLYGMGTLFIASCVAPQAGSPLSVAGGMTAQPQQQVMALSTPSATPSATENAALMAEVTLLFSRATDTAVAAEKTEQAYIAAQQTHVAETQVEAGVQTIAAQETQFMATAIATQTQMAQTAIATVTYGAMTEVIANTGTAMAMTKAIETDRLNAARVGVWGIAILSLCAGALAIAFLCVKVYGQIKDVQARHLRDTQIEPDQNGRYPVVPASSLRKDDKLVNVNLAHRAVTDLAHDDLSTEQALINAQSQRALEATRAIAQSSVLMKKLLAPAKQASVENEASMPEANMDIRKMGAGYLTDGKNIVTPAWNLFESWDGKGGIPFGISERGLEQVSIQLVPHGGVFGKTGSGKSRGFLRPFIAGAIASGQRVVILGKEVDFWPFAQHPNVKMIGIRNITQEEEAARYADYLLRIVEEMNRRDAYLTANHVSTWDKAGRESTLIVLDELGNALDMMPANVRPEAYRWVSGLVSEGRKYGFNIWLATQRAVGFKRIVEQLGRAVFYLADAEASRYALGFAGAETLGAGQFFAKFHRTMKCASFDPSDDELTHFLQGRQVKVHEPISWLEGSVVEETKAEGGVQNAEEDVDAKIVRLYQEMKQVDRVSLSQIQREVYGDVNTGGAHFRHIQDLIGKINEGTTTTGNMPGSDLLSSSATA